MTVNYSRTLECDHPENVTTFLKWPLFARPVWISLYIQSFAPLIMWPKADLLMWPPIFAKYWTKSDHFSQNMTPFLSQTVTTFPNVTTFHIFSRECDQFQWNRPLFSLKVNRTLQYLRNIPVEHARSPLIKWPLSLCDHFWTGPKVVTLPRFRHNRFLDNFFL